MKRIQALVLIGVMLLSFTSCKLSSLTNEREDISYYIPTVEKTTASFYMIGENEVQLSNISFYIPENFEVKSKNGELTLEDEKRKLQFTVEDKTDDITDLDKYIQETIISLKQMGLSAGEIEPTTIGSYTAKRFTVDTFDITSSSIRMFCYFINIGDSKIILNVISRGNELRETLEADEFVSEIQFN